VLPNRIARVFSVILQCTEVDAFLTTLIYRLIAIIHVTSFPQSLSGNPLISLDTRFRGYDNLCALSFVIKHYRTVGAWPPGGLTPPLPGGGHESYLSDQPPGAGCGLYLAQKTFCGSIASTGTQASATFTSTLKQCS
jgi:hypothetical protein